MTFWVLILSLMVSTPCFGEVVTEKTKSEIIFENAQKDDSEEPEMTTDEWRELETELESYNNPVRVANRTKCNEETSFCREHRYTVPEEQKWIGELLFYQDECELVSQRCFCSHGEYCPDPM